MLYKDVGIGLLSRCLRTRRDPHIIVARPGIFRAHDPGTYLTGQTWPLTPARVLGGRGARQTRMLRGGRPRWGAAPATAKAYVFSTISPYMNNTMIAPIIEAIQPALSPASYHPTATPRYPATNAPTMPRMMVMTMPIFCSPGMMALAISPTISPTMIMLMIPMATTP